MSFNPLNFLSRKKNQDKEIRRIRSAFRKRFGVDFKDLSLLRMALTHGSYEGSETSNERLEFLGDAVLNLVATDYVYGSMPEADEGDLTKARATIVNKAILGRLAMRMGLLDILLYARDEIESDERALISLSADALEAVIGAIFLDRGFSFASRFVLDRIIMPISSGLIDQVQPDYKSRLQEVCQAIFKIHPEYRIIKKTGPEHRKTFYVEVKIMGKVYGHGAGRSRKEAEQMAASQALAILEKPESSIFSDQHEMQ
ncbi:MAG: ribonuclease III [bacterium]